MPITYNYLRVLVPPESDICVEIPSRERLGWEFVTMNTTVLSDRTVDGKRDIALLHLLLFRRPA